MQNYKFQFIATNLNISPLQVKNTIKLLEEGSTIPFIARYRKELTESLDEVKIQKIKDTYEGLVMIDMRRDSVIKSLTKMGKLTKELKDALDKAITLTQIEDIYLPYKPKRQTRAQKAKDNGLEPLAKEIFKQKNDDFLQDLSKYLNEKIKNEEEALGGARDIIAEWINEDKEAREKVRYMFNKDAKISSRVLKSKRELASKYEDYFDYEELLNDCPSHRMLALRRGEKESFLVISISPNTEKTIDELRELFIKNNSKAAEQVDLALNDAYKRLLKNSIETEFRLEAKEKADEDSINVFAKNLRQLLLAPALGNRRVLAIDPGFRTGCKVACLDEMGELLDNFSIYPHPPINDEVSAKQKLLNKLKKYNINVIAIGNGTAGRETEQFINSIVDSTVDVFMVCEDGASIYSSSAIARQEFPDKDITVRGAISIGRRLMDPLAELIKIDPKSIGVGQYQHDVDQLKLKSSLDIEVISCVNHVGVDLNTASEHLLKYVSGLGSNLATNIVTYRKENGVFKNRAELFKVKLMGQKTFEQAAGFLRIKDGDNPLDNTAVHPERYELIKVIADDLNMPIKELINLRNISKIIDKTKYINDSIGMPTLDDIVSELEKPSRDPRETIKIFKFAENVHSLEDLKKDMIIPGVVTNITNFGAFVNIGIKEDGLIHISQMSDKYVADPNEIVSLEDKVFVKVIDIDKDRGRIQLSLKNLD